jgi:peptide/nickel transport system permease protein
MADLGIRFSAAIIFLASLNYLGLGLQPPAADWALMISENRQIATTNIWAVLAPMIPLALLTIGVNLVADSYARSRGGNRG